MKHVTQFAMGRQCVLEGDIIAYPTEAVYGLGCDPFNEQAVTRLLALKQRGVEKGLILLIAHWEQLFSLIDELPQALLLPVKNTWPGPVTWVFPKARHLPEWITGSHDSIAIRMSAHPIARELCKDHPLVSTSANQSGQPPATDLRSLCQQFPQGIDAVFEGDLGGSSKPSDIFDVQTGARLR